VRRRANKPPKKATEAYLERAALHYLERYAGSEARLRRVLKDRVRRSFDAHGTPEPEEAAERIDALITKLDRLGYVDDARVARSRVKSLRARGKSTRAIRAVLRGAGIDASVIDATLDDGDDLEAACAYVRRRRLTGGERDLAKLARAGTQIGQVVYAALNRVPRAASPSRLGVCTIGCPAQPIRFELCSSDIMTKRFCGFII
jgi:regulatory protein